MIVENSNLVTLSTPEFQYKTLIYMNNVELYIE